MKIKIERMNGHGNRFAIMDIRALSSMSQGASQADMSKLMSKLARRAGDYDQALFLLPPRHSGVKNGLFMEIFNIDGSRTESCGNGTRCVAWSEMQRLDRPDIIIETEGGILLCRMKGDEVEVDMGAPRFNWPDIPLAENMPTDRIAIAGAEKLGAGTAINVGNPHIVFFPQDMDRLDIKHIGADLEHHKLFPEGINVILAEQKAPDHLKIKVWERGAGATRSCGTAACASLIAAHRRNMDIARAAKIELPGGFLDICWRSSDGHILMTGPVAFDGEDMIDVKQ